MHLNLKKQKKYKNLPKNLSIGFSEAITEHWPISTNGTKK